MTPKEKAEELVSKFKYFTVQESWELKNYYAFECALIAVDEVINELDDNFDSLHCSDIKEFWRKVKEEIELL
jgi:hypothetical protein